MTRTLQAEVGYNTIEQYTLHTFIPNQELVRQNERAKQIRAVRARRRRAEAYSRGRYQDSQCRYHHHQQGGPYTRQHVTVVSIIVLPWLYQFPNADRMPPVIASMHADNSYNSHTSCLPDTKSPIHSNPVSKSKYKQTIAVHPFKQ